MRSSCRILTVDSSHYDFFRCFLTDCTNTSLARRSNSSRCTALLIHHEISFDTGRRATTFQLLCFRGGGSPSYVAVPVMFRSTIATMIMVMMVVLLHDTELQIG